MHSRKLICALFQAFGLALSPVFSQAQTHLSLDWSLVDGVGGISAYGDLAVVGTISPEDSGLLASGPFSIHSVFDPWPGNFTPFMPPTLRISLATNDVIIRWSDRYPRLQLEQTTTLNEPATNWTDVSETAVLSSFEWHVTVPATNRSRFFRLRLFSD